MLLELSHWAFKDLLWIQSHHGTPDIFPCGVLARMPVIAVHLLMHSVKQPTWTAVIFGCLAGVLLLSRLALRLGISYHSLQVHLQGGKNAILSGCLSGSDWTSRFSSPPPSTPPTLIHLKGLAVFWFLISYALCSRHHGKGFIASCCCGGPADDASAVHGSWASSGVLPNPATGANPLW